MVEYEKTTAVELANITAFLHLIKPSTKDMFVCGIEKAQPYDQNVTFHLVPRSAEDRKKGETQVVLVSAQYIIDHPFWKQGDEEND